MGIERVNRSVGIAAVSCVLTLVLGHGRAPADAQVSPYGRVLVEVAGVLNGGIPPWLPASAALNRDVQPLLGWHVGGGARVRWGRVAMRVGADVSVRGIGNLGSEHGSTGQVAPLLAVTPHAAVELRAGSATALFLEAGAPLQLWAFSGTQLGSIPEAAIVRGDRIAYGIGFRASFGVTRTLSERAQLVWGVSFERHTGAFEGVRGVPDNSAFATTFHAFGLFVGVAFGR